MSLSKIEIVNKALHELGVERINSIDDNQKRAKVMKDIYDIERRGVLEDHVWSFARKRIEVTPLVGTPAFEWTYQFQLPSDWIRAVKEFNNVCFEIEGDLALSNGNKLQLVYIFDQQDTSKFSPKFANCLALRLAATAAYTLLNKQTLKDRLLQDYKNELSLGRFTHDSQQPPQDYDISDFIDVRGG